MGVKKMSDSKPIPIPLLNVYREHARRLKMIVEMEGKTCLCSVYSLLDDCDYAVPYLYCVIEEGRKRVNYKDINFCIRCSKAPCEHFYDPEYDDRECKDFTPRKSVYPTSPCPYANPSDEDIASALIIHSKNRRDRKW
jgi:hypothetical protein